LNLFADFYSAVKNTEKSDVGKNAELSQIFSESWRP
jgi:hypothetical protein